ncbi:multidrug ABC transporter permease [Shouchella clausii]|uniref:lantibiotic immunity ABC transporter MutE/EpiE family permease subunit n=1 Tax=Shouchella clausii TaxID=79880 RepID=UPI001B2398AF|nr:lantibiotic immunity ABC transporter MutE/EpiE family permease subunit [Shouchella clausii]GIN18046.1 multidrug ABC transporter permease [Shouchella clausii]
MFISYMKAENLKLKRTFARKMIGIVPLLTVAFSFIMNMEYFVYLTFNWWSILFMPMMIALFCALAHVREKQASNYNGIYSAPVDLRLVWLAKASVIALYSLASQLIFLVIMFLIEMVVPLFPVGPFPVIAACFLLWATTLWQIPFCLLLAKKFGFAVSLIVNLFGCLAFGIIAATKAYWWAWPWSWPIRAMSPTIGIHPNGLPLEEDDPLLSMTVIPIAIILSLLLFAVLLMISGKSFAFAVVQKSKQEVA